MTITITIPWTARGLAGVVAQLAEPGLLAAVALAGVGPAGQALVSGAVRLARCVQIERGTGGPAPVAM